MRLSEAGAARIANYEGFRANAYWDVNHYSIGYGTRARSASEGPISLAEAQRRLRHHADVAVGKAVRALRLPLNQNQFDACVSIGYNLGAGIFGDDWTLGAALRAKLLIPEAADAFLLYDKSEGVVLAGLTRRRREERALFLKPPPVAFTDDERHLLGRMKNGDLSRAARRSAANALKVAARGIQTRARAEKHGWEKNDRARRYQGIRRALKRHGYL